MSNRGERAPTINGRPRLSWPAGHHQTARGTVQTNYAGDSQWLCGWSTACQPVRPRRSGGDRRRPVAGNIRMTLWSSQGTRMRRSTDHLRGPYAAEEICSCSGSPVAPEFAILPPAGRVSGPMTRRWPPAARVSRPRPGRSGMPASALGLAAAHRRQPDHARMDSCASPAR